MVFNNYILDHITRKRKCLRINYKSQYAISFFEGEKSTVQCRSITSDAIELQVVSHKILIRSRDNSPMSTRGLITRENHVSRVSLVFRVPKHAPLPRAVLCRHRNA